MHLEPLHATGLELRSQSKSTIIYELVKLKTKLVNIMCKLKRRVYFVFFNLFALLNHTTADIIVMFECHHVNHNRNSKCKIY